MSDVTRLIVVRHGNTFNSGDVILRVGSATDIPLTEKGLLQGEAVGKALLEHGYVIDTIFHAPLLRTIQSAAGISKAYPDATVKEADFLTELDYGQDDGKPEDDVVLRLGIVEKHNEIMSQTSLDELRAAGKAALKRWDSEAVLPLAWDFLADRTEKLSADWDEFAAKVLQEYAGKTVVAVTSNGIARFSKVLLPAGTQLDGSLKLATGAFGVYEYFDGVWHCGAWNVRPEL